MDNPILNASIFMGKFIRIQRVIRPLVKSVYQKINFLVSQPKHVVGT